MLYILYIYVKSFCRLVCTLHTMFLYLLYLCLYYPSVSLQRRDITQWFNLLLFFCSVACTHSSGYNRVFCYSAERFEVLNRRAFRSMGFVYSFPQDNFGEKFYFSGLMDFWDLDWYLITKYIFKVVKCLRQFEITRLELTETYARFNALLFEYNVQICTCINKWLYYL